MSARVEQRHREAAGRCWCDPTTSDREMDVALAVCGGISSILTELLRVAYSGWRCRRCRSIRDAVMKGGRK